MAEDNRLFKDWEDNFEKYETRIRIVFGISAVSLPTFFGLLAGGVSEMTVIWVIGFGVSFWALLISGSLLLKNSSRTETNRRLTNIETQLKNLDKLDRVIELLEEMVKHRQQPTDKPKQ